MKTLHALSMFALTAMIGFGSCSDNVGTASHETKKEDTLATTPSTTSGSSQANTSQDTTYLRMAMVTDMMEIKSSEAATQNSTNKTVKDLAKMMIDEHTKMSQLTGQVASAKGVQPPADLPAEKQALLSKAAALKGTEFDKEYISQLVSGHQEAIQMLQSASQQAQDTAVRSWATTALPRVQHHLMMIQEAQSKLK